MNNVSPDPRLPIPPSDGYQKQLNVRLYEVLRDINIRLNYLLEGGTLNVTTTEKNALTPTAGRIVFDTTLGKACVATGSAWQTITSA